MLLQSTGTREGPCSCFHNNYGGEGKKLDKAEAVGLVYLESKVRRLCLVTRKI
jgi:hypothetical protein